LLVDAVDENNPILGCFALNLHGVKTGKFQVWSKIATDIGVYGSFG